MKIIETNKEDIMEVIHEQIEKQTQKTISNMTVLGDGGTEEEPYLEVAISFADQAIMKARITVQTIDGQLACRIQGKYI